MMRHRLLLMVGIMVFTVWFGQIAVAAEDIFVAEPMAYEGPDFMPGQIIVQFRPGVPESVIAQINEKNKAKVAYTSQFARFRVLEFPEAIPPQAMARIYQSNPNVEYAELNYVARASAVPNDPYYRYQWHLDNSVYGGIGMEEAWDLSTGAGVTVAVVDTGVKLGGPDGVPASGGRDFVNGDLDPDDDNGHGTHVAGTIAQNTGNSRGVAGVAYGCSILPVKVLNASGSGTYAWIADGIRYAADQGAKVINMSLGGPSPSTTLESAVAYAYGKGVTIVCSSGNDGSLTTVGYPAAYNAYCIAVGATRYDETVAPYSNGGSALDLTAPGGDTSVNQNGDPYADGVLQETYRSGRWGYWFFQGTSMAAPHVSGVAALVISKGIATSPDDVRNVLQSTAEDKGTPGWDARYGWGIVDAYAALQFGGPPNQPPNASFTHSTSNLTCNVDASGSSDPDGTITGYAWDFGDGATGAGVTASHTYAAADTYTVTLTVTDNDGAEDSTWHDITVTSPPPPENEPPIASFTWSATGLTCNVNASGSSDPDGTIVNYHWDFGDDSSDTGITASHTYAAAGTYTVTLTVTDDDGAQGENSQQVTVTSSSGGELLRVKITAKWTVSRSAGKNTFVAAFAELEVGDEYGHPVEGATVRGEWSNAVSSVATSVTDNEGVTVLTSPEAKAPRKGGSLTFVLTITNVELAGYTYDPGNSETTCTISWP